MGGPLFASGVIWKTAPDDRPDQTIVLKIESIRSVLRWSGFIAKVRDGPRAMVGNSYRFTPESSTSCGSIGRSKGYIVVRRTPVLRDFGDESKVQAYLSAISFEESWFNWFVSLFSDDFWQFPGKQVLENDTIFAHQPERTHK